MLKILKYLSIGMIFPLSCYGQTEIESLQAQAQAEKPQAYRYAQEFVKRRLKAPATAQFPVIEQTTIKCTVDKKGDKISYSVAGFVDAQNSFGALLRSRFLVHLHHKPGQDYWKSGIVIVR